MAVNDKAAAVPAATAVDNAVAAVKNYRAGKASTSAVQQSLLGMDDKTVTLVADVVRISRDTLLAIRDLRNLF